MIYAQIKDGKVFNIIELKDESLVPKFQEGFDSLIKIEEGLIRPSKGFLYNENKFIDPNPKKEPSQGFPISSKEFRESNQGILSSSYCLNVFKAIIRKKVISSALDWDEFYLFSISERYKKICVTFDFGFLAEAKVLIQDVSILSAEEKTYVLSIIDKCISEAE